MNGYICCGMLYIFNVARLCLISTSFSPDYAVVWCHGDSLLHLTMILQLNGLDMHIMMLLLSCHYSHSQENVTQ